MITVDLIERLVGRRLRRFRRRMRPPRVSGDSATVARRIVASRCQRIGFVPADDRTEAAPAIAAIAQALAEVSDRGIATVGAPASVTDKVSSSKRHGRSLTESRSDASGSSDGIWTFNKIGSVSTFVPAEEPEPGRWLTELGEFLSRSLATRELVLVDFSGLERVGELAAAAAVVDGSCVIARAYRTKENEMERAAASLPLDRFLGVLLV